MASEKDLIAANKQFMVRKTDRKRHAAWQFIDGITPGALLIVRFVIEN